MNMDYDDFQRYLLVSGLVNEDKPTNNEGCFETLFKGALIYIIAIVLAFFVAIILIILISIL